MSPERRARVLLALGAAAGLATAAATLLREDRRALPPEAVALVNDVPIRRDEYLRALGAVASDRRTSLDDADKQRVLDRLIDEELLVERGLTLGLARRDQIVRAQLVATTIDLLSSSTAEPSADELRAFYDSHQEYFSEPGKLRVRQILVRTHGRPDDVARARADEAAHRLAAGEGFDTVRNLLGDEEMAPIPNALLPVAKLREYIGDTAVTATLSHDVGETIEPIRSSMGFHVLQVVERTAPYVPPFDEIVDRVRGEYRRRGDDARLRAALAELRRGARIRAEERLP